MSLPEEGLLNALNSVEYAIYKHLYRAQESYGLLCNSEDHSSAKDHLRSLQAALIDAYRQIKQVLYVWGCPVDQIINVNQRTQDNLDNLFLNVMHFYQRFAHAPRKDKIKELTALYFLVQDTSAIAQEVSVDRYYKHMEHEF